MNINVKQVVVSVKNCKTIQDIMDLTYLTIGDTPIVRYSLSSDRIIFYVEVPPSESNFIMEVGATEFTDSISVILEFATLFGECFSDAAEIVELQKENPVQKMEKQLRAERENYIQQMRSLVDTYINQKIRIPNSQIEFINGGVQIFKDDNTIILLLDKYELEFDPESYEIEDESQRNTTIIRRSDKIRDGYFDQNEEIDIEQLQQELESLTQFWEELEEKRLVNIDESHEREVSMMKNLIQMFNDTTGENITMAEAVTQRKDVKQIHNILSSLDAIENDEYDEEQSRELSEQDIEVEQMRTFIDSVKDDGQTRLLTPDGAIPLKSATYAQELETVVDEEISTEELDFFTKGYRNTTTIIANVETISFDKFDDMAAKYHIVGWDLSTPNTLSIKFIEGTTPESTIQKFHNMMESLDTGWLNTAHFNNLKNLEESTKFLAELRNIISDDTDVAQEFINRVKKHNIFVRETMAKMRSALLDMENDFERVLKDEVNLSIDWETLTAFAAKKERTETRIKGVEFASKTNGIVSVNSILPPSNLVKISTGFVDGDFYIPEHLVTDELRSKYVIDDHYVYYIDDVPDYAFYEIQVNGHYLLIEKTDL